MSEFCLWIFGITRTLVAGAHERSAWGRSLATGFTLTVVEAGTAQDR